MSLQTESPWISSVMMSVTIPSIDTTRLSMDTSGSCAAVIGSGGGASSLPMTSAESMSAFHSDLFSENCSQVLGKLSVL